MMEVSDQLKVLTTSSHLSASLMILLTTWPDSTPRGVGCREKLPEQGKGVLLQTVGLSVGGWGYPAEGGIQIRSNRNKGAVGA